MGFIHIIVLVVVIILLIGAFFITKVHSKDSNLNTSPDIITKFIEAKEEELHEARINFSLTWYLRLIIICPIVLGTIVFFLTNNGIMAVLTAIVSIFIPRGIMLLMISSRNKKLEEGFAQSLDSLATSLHAGMSILGAVKDVAQNNLLKNEFIRKCYGKLTLNLEMGIPATEAFYIFAEDIGTDDAKDVALAIDLQNEIGGHEAEVIYEISHNIHERMMMRREIRTAISSSTSTVAIMDFIAPGGMLLFAISNSSLFNAYFSNPTLTVLFFIFIIMPFIGSIITHRALNKIKKES